MLKTKNKEKSVKTVLQNDRGIALITVILIIAILGILAAVAIETTGTDIINAGNYTSSEQTLSISNSAMNIVLAQLNTSQQTNAGIGMPSPNVYYYTPQVNNTLQQSNNYVALTAANIDSNFSNVLGFTINSGNFGFEYNGTYGGIPGYSLNYHFYNGQINTITQNQSGSKTARTGMTFSYGPVQVGY
ncbi:MAG: hypothetical protein M1478_02100 [Deltaproteobacteria bacterium]|jgi:hypothetical protein|nr:hypothetical protein [Deltaproteobacteria bacterium]MCL5879607.1 hypothetical protein [Deltaproteobacteria bacterium]